MIESFGLVVFLDFLECPEIVFDRVEVWRIRGQEGQGCPCPFDQLSGFPAFVKGHAIHDDDLVFVQTWAKRAFQPTVKSFASQVL